MEILVYGTINSVALALYALGFALVYGTSRLPNFAHGALYVLSGFIAWSALNTLGLPYLPSILLTLIVTGIIGALIYQFVLIRVRGMEISEIIATYAIALAILEGLRWGGFKGMTYTLPAFIEGSTSIAGVSVDYQRLLVVVIGAALVACLWLFTHHTRIGRAFRAIAQDERTALSLGINSDRMATLSISLGAMLAGIAAITIFPLGTLSISEGYNVLLIALAVSIIGGLGNTGGVVLASLLIGFSEQFTDFYVGSNWRMSVSLAAMCLVLIIKPSGLLGQQKELEERI